MVRQGLTTAAESTMPSVDFQARDGESRIGRDHTALIAPLEAEGMRFPLDEAAKAWTTSHSEELDASNVA